MRKAIAILLLVLALGSTAACEHVDDCSYGNPAQDHWAGC